MPDENEKAIEELALKLDAEFNEGFGCLEEEIVIIRKAIKEGIRIGQQKEMAHNDKVCEVYGLAQYKRGRAEAFEDVREALSKSGMPSSSIDMALKEIEALKKKEAEIGE